jgi:hypothetical protein
MPVISLTDFVDFVVASGPPRLTKVRELKRRGIYEPATDFWKRLREAIETLHREDREKPFLDEVRVGLTDRKKLAAYPPLITAYKRFLGRKHTRWFDPPRGRWAHAELTVRVNPELGLDIDGNRHVVKLYFKKQPLSKRRVESILRLMEKTLKAGEGESFAVAVLDVANAKLIRPTIPVPDLDILLQSEAAAFMEIWQRLEREG